MAISYIGATLAVVAATPATVDASGFGALSYVSCGKIISFGQTGDTSEDIGVPYLAGRNEHVNGIKDGGALPFAFTYDIADAGQIILRAQSNSQTTVSFRITDPDGKIEYFHGVVANIQQNERSSGSYKGQSGEVRVNSAVITV